MRRIDDMNWMGVEKYLAQDDRIIFVLGACEEHGYLSLLTDAKIPAALAEAASQAVGVVVAPVVNFGVSPYFLTYPGTLSLRVSTLLDLVEDLVRSAYGQGFRRFLFLNGHGGNDPVRIRLVELANQLPDLRMNWYSWWLAPCVEEVATRHGLKRNHASWMEAFSFTRVTELPQGEKDMLTPGRLMNAEQTRQYYGDGVFGGAYQAGETVMDEVFQACLKDVIELLQFK